MINFFDGDILESGSEIICHQVNCQGVMGSGLALQIREKYPIVFSKYKELCDAEENKKDLLGRVQLVTVDKNTVIANCFGQFTFGRDENVTYTSYEALKECFEFLGKLSGGCGYSLAIPFNIGCGLGNGDWEVVLEIINKKIPKNADCSIWKY